jgi:L-iditol 2-dehydrogenase
MKTALFYGTHDIRIEEGSDAEPRPGEILLDVTAVGVCGSDLHTYTLGNIGGIGAESPLVLGHEAAGRVVAVGKGVAVEHFRPGQLVAIDPAIPCGQCERCLAGDPHLCLRLIFIGLYPHHGALRERMAHPAHACIPLPDTIDDVEGALLEPLGVAWHAIRLAKIQIGEDVLVTGSGAIGLLLVRLARLSGARRIFVSDKYAHRLAIAANYGADKVIEIGTANVVEEVMRATNGRGVDVAIEAAWVAGTINDCVESARFGGRVIIVGIPAEEEMMIKASPARRKELTITLSRRMKHSYPTAISLVESGRVDLKPLASHQYPLGKTAAAFETAAAYSDSIVRAVVLPGITE